MTAVGPVDHQGLVQAVRDAARRGDLRRATRLAEAARVLIPDGAPGALELANVRGGIAFELGELDRAEACYEDVIRRASDEGNLLLAARAATNLGSIAHLRGEGVRATSLYARALTACEQGGDTLGVARAEHNLGILERELGALERAAAHAERAVAAARRTRDAGLIALTLLGEAEVLLEQGERESVHRRLAAARALAERVDDALVRVEAHRLEARLALRQQQDLAALYKARRAYLQARRLGCRQLCGECAILASQASRRLGRARLADRFRLLAEESFRSLGTPATLRRLETV